MAKLGWMIEPAVAIGVPLHPKADDGCAPAAAEFAGTIFDSPFGPLIAEIQASADVSVGNKADELARIAKRYAEYVRSIDDATQAKQRSPASERQRQRPRGALRRLFCCC